MITLAAGPSANPPIKEATELTSNFKKGGNRGSRNPINVKANAAALNSPTLVMYFVLFFAVIMSFPVLLRAINLADAGFAFHPIDKARQCFVAVNI